MFFLDRSTKPNRFFICYLKFTVDFHKIRKHDISKKLGLVSFIKDRPQNISTYNNSRFVENLILYKPVKFCLVPVKIDF